MTPAKFVDYSVERWAQAVREKVSLSWVDFILAPVFVWVFTQFGLTDGAGLRWWQALPISIPGAALITVAWWWLRRKGYVEWEE